MSTQPKDPQNACPMCGATESNAWAGVPGRNGRVCETCFSVLMLATTCVDEASRDAGKQRRLGLGYGVLSPSLSLKSDLPMRGDDRFVQVGPEEFDMYDLPKGPLSPLTTVALVLQSLRVALAEGEGVDRLQVSFKLERGAAKAEAQSKTKEVGGA